MFSAMRAAALTVVLVLPSLVTVPATQALLVRWVSPRLTLRMVGATIDELRESGRFELVDSRFRRLEHFPPHLPRAVVTAEDGKFFAHNGFDMDGICAAIEHNRKGGSLRGGSTISQQTARNVFLWQGRNYVRKGLEAVYTFWLELLVPKERILELYVNVAETGPRVFGFEAAAEHWYDRSGDTLTADQSSRLASVLPNPNRRTPQSKTAANKARWIARNQAPMPGDRGLELLIERVQARPWWPPCP